MSHLPLNLSEFLDMVFHSESPSKIFIFSTDDNYWGVSLVKSDVTYQLHTARGKLRFFSTLDSAYSCISSLSDFSIIQII